MSHLNFKKMYLLSREMYDVLKALSMQNTNNSSIPTPTKKSHSIDSQNIIIPTRQNTNDRKRKISNSNNGEIVDIKKQNVQIFIMRVKKCRRTNEKNK